jgi:signal transduction histidine kinase
MHKIKYYLLESIDVRIILVAVIYFLSAYFGLLLAFRDPITSPVWPPVGIGLALILFLGVRTWPGITIGSLIAYMLVFWLNGIEINSGTIQASIIISIGNTIEILLGRYLLHLFIKDDDPFKNTHNTFVFLIIALVMCLVGSSLGTYSFHLNGIVNKQEFISQWFFWWIPNVTSVLLFTPFFLSWKRKFNLQITRRTFIESLIFLFCMALFIVILRNEALAPTIEKSYPFLIIPFLLWLSFRFNLQTTLTGILITALSAIYITINGQGPFVLDSNENSILILQIFISVISITSIILSSTVYERHDAQLTIQKFNETLETKIEERTSALNDEISFRKRAEDKLKVTNRQLRKANVELDNFVYKVSHDLRAPIASVLGLVNLAKKENKFDTLKDYFDMVGRSAVQQDSFIRDILDLSRNSRLLIDKKRINWQELINDTFDHLKFSVKDKAIERKININGRVSFYSDQRRIKVIFNNLISNAIRYSNGKDPVIEIDVKINKSNANITITDNGVGIEKKHQKKVFEMFYRATDANAGSGLGLYIVKESIDKLNGNIDMMSDVGIGTKFLISLPNLKK